MKIERKEEMNNKHQDNENPHRIVTADENAKPLAADGTTGAWGNSDERLRSGTIDAASHTITVSTDGTGVSNERMILLGRDGGYDWRPYIHHSLEEDAPNALVVEHDQPFPADKALRGMATNNWSWCQHGYCEAVFAFTTMELAIEHAQKHAMKSKPVTIYQEGESDGEMTFWRESATYEWNVNMRLVFNPDPRTKSELQESIDRRPCCGCGNTSLAPLATLDALYCRLCGKQQPLVGQ